MFGAGYFGKGYFGGGYFGPGAEAAEEGIDYGDDVGEYVEDAIRKSLEAHKKYPKDKESNAEKIKALSEKKAAQVEPQKPKPEKKPGKKPATVIHFPNWRRPLPRGKRAEEAKPGVGDLHRPLPSVESVRDAYNATLEAYKKKMDAAREMREAEQERQLRAFEAWQEELRRETELQIRKTAEDEIQRQIFAAANKEFERLRREKEDEEELEDAVAVYLLLQ